MVQPKSRVYTMPSPCVSSGHSGVQPSADPCTGTNGSIVGTRFGSYLTNISPAWIALVFLIRGMPDPAGVNISIFACSGLCSDRTQKKGSTTAFPQSPSAVGGCRHPCRCIASPCSFSTSTWITPWCSFVLLGFFDPGSHWHQDEFVLCESFACHQVPWAECDLESLVHILILLSRSRSFFMMSPLTTQSCDALVPDTRFWL